MVLKDLMDLKTIKRRNMIRADVTKKIALCTLVTFGIASAGLITGIIISPKVRKKFSEVKKDVLELGSDIKDDLAEGYKEVTKDIKDSASDLSEDLKTKKR